MRSFYIFIFCIAILGGYLCSQTSNFIDAVSMQYQKEENKLDKLIDIFQDWKEKDTTKL